MSRFRIPRSSPRRGHPGALRKRTLQLELLEMRCVLTGTFTSISLPPGTGANGLGTLLLLTDGTVLAHETEHPDLNTNFPNVQYIGSTGWWRLSPGPNGFYSNGTWTQVHDMAYARAFFNEQVLPSGKVLVLGSECPKDINVLDWQTVECFDPSNPMNPWTMLNTRDTDQAQAPFTVFHLYHKDGSITDYQGYIGAEATKILPPQGDGDTRILVPMEPSADYNGNIVANSNGYVNQIFDVTANNWSRPINDPLQQTSYLDRGQSGSTNAQAGEECWVLLPPTSDALNGSILTTDSSYQYQNLTARRYIPPDATYAQTGHWVNTTNNLPDQIRDGPAVLLPATTLSGEQAWYTGEFGTTAYYNIANGAWNTQAGPPLPLMPGSQSVRSVAFDTPAAVLPTGQVLILTGPPPGTDPGTGQPDNFPAPYYTWEFSPSNQSFSSNSLLTGPAARGVAEISPFYCHMLVLPTGQILMSTGPQKTLYLYSHTSDATDLNLTNLRPGINNIPNASGNQFSLTGYRLNGVTEGAYYGDDASMSTNYPLIRFTKNSASFISSNLVYYGITSAWSNTGIEAPGDTSQMTMNFKMSDVFYNNVNGVYNGQYTVQVVVNGIPSSGTPWTLTKNGLSNQWTQGGFGPGGGASAPPNGPVIRPPVVNQAIVVAGDNALTVAAQSGNAVEQPLERSETGGSTTGHPITWDTGVARVLGNEVTSPDPKSTELAFLDLGEGDLKGM